MRGFTLVELTVTLGLLSLSALFGVTLYQAQYKERKKIEITTVASGSIRQFFDLRRKLIEASTQTTFTSYSPVSYLNPNTYTGCTAPSSVAPFCQEVYQALTINANSPRCATVRETVEVECVTKDSRVSPIDLDKVPGPGKRVFRKCAPEECNSSSDNILGGTTEAPRKLPRIKVTRWVKEMDALGNCLATEKKIISYFPPGPEALSNHGMDGNPIAAVACMQFPPGATAATYRDFNLSVFMLARFGEDKFEIIHQVASFPRPKNMGSDSTVILGPSGD